MFYGRKRISYLHANMVKRDKIMRHGAMERMASDHAPVMDADLEDALELAGAGRYQFVHSLLMLCTLLAAILEMIGVAFILPAAACDLDVPDNLKGIITSLPNIGVILTAPFWGRASDSLGRKPVLLGSLIAAGVMAFIAAFMPSLITFVLFKFACSLFLSSPSSLGYAYMSEVLPRKSRDMVVLIVNSLINILTVFSPGLAWIILSYNWMYPLGAIDMRPWRLLTAIYALPLIVSGLSIIGMDESPKFLISRGKDKEALEVLRKIYSVNTGMPPESYCIKSLKATCDVADPDQRGSESALTPKSHTESALALLRPPHLKWFALTSLLMFGLFTLLNGLFLFSPDTINRVMNSEETSGTICELLNQSDNSTVDAECQDSISYNTFYIMVVTTVVYGVLIIIASVSPLSKKTLLVAMFIVVGIGCLIAGLSTNRILAGVAMSSLQITALGIGPLSAYVVTLFPTTLRGTALGAVMMFGRLGSIAGANVAGITLHAFCMATFYGFATLVFVCAGLSLLLPADQVKKPEEATSDTSSS